MIDKKLLRLLGENQKYIVYTVAWMILGLFANISMTACICRIIAGALALSGTVQQSLYCIPASCGIA